MVVQTDKELAVSIVNAYISAWFSHSSPMQKPLDSKMLSDLLRDAYAAIQSLDSDNES